MNSLSGSGIELDPLAVEHRTSARDLSVDVCTFKQTNSVTDMEVANLLLFFEFRASDSFGDYGSMRLGKYERIKNMPLLLDVFSCRKLVAIEKHINKLMVQLGGRAIPKRKVEETLDKFPMCVREFLYAALDANSSEYVAIESSSIVDDYGVHHPYLGSLWFIGGSRYPVLKVKKVWRKGKHWFASVVVDRSRPTPSTMVEGNDRQARIMTNLFRAVKRAKGEAVEDGDAYGVVHAKTFNSHYMNYLRIPLDECKVISKRLFVEKFNAGRAARIYLPYFRSERSGLYYLTHDIPEGTKFLDVYQTDDRSNFHAYFRSE